MQSCIVDAILHRSSANMNLKVNAERFVVASKKHAIVSIRFTAHSLLTAHPPQNTIVIPALPEYWRMPTEPLRPGWCCIFRKKLRNHPSPGILTMLSSMTQSISRCHFTLAGIFGPGWSMFLSDTAL